MTPALAPHLAPYRKIVVAQMPTCDEMSIRRRCGILHMRDTATRMLLTVTDDAAAILQNVESMASHHVFRPMSKEELAAIHYALVRLTATASGLNALAKAGR